MDESEFNLYLDGVEKFVPSDIRSDPRVQQAITSKPAEFARLKREAEERERQRLEDERLKAEAAKQSLEAQALAKERARLERERREIEEAKKKIEEDKKIAETPVLRQPEGDLKVKGIRTIWKCKIVSPDSVPREFCSPDPAKIREAIKNGNRDIPGISIYQEKTV